MWKWQCTTTGLDNSTELRMEKIREAVTEIWVPQFWQLPTRPPARIVTTIPLQPGGLRGKNEGHIWDLSFNWCFCCCCFMTIRPCLSCDMAIKIVDLKNSKSRACPVKVKIDGYIWGLAFNWYVQFPFSVYSDNFFLDIGNSIFELKNPRSRSRTGPRSKSTVKFEA